MEVGVGNVVVVVIVFVTVDVGVTGRISIE